MPVHAFLFMISTVAACASVPPAPRLGAVPAISRDSTCFDLPGDAGVRRMGAAWSSCQSPAGRRRAGVSLSRRPLSLVCVLDPERARRTCGIVQTSASKEE